MSELKDVLLDVVLLLFILYLYSVVLAMTLTILSPLCSVILLFLGYIFFIIIFKNEIKTVITNIAKWCHSNF